MKPPGSSTDGEAGTPASGRPRDAAVVEASRRVVAVFLERKTSDVPIRELAAQAGISERTFYRYFPRKEDAIRPSIDDGLALIVSRIRGSADSQPLLEVVEDAYATSFRDGAISDWGTFWRILNETESLRATWLQVLIDSEHAIGAAMAERLGEEPGSDRARLAGALVVTAARAALETAFEGTGDRRPRKAFAQNLRLLSPLLFTARAASPRTRTSPRRKRPPARR